MLTSGWVLRSINLVQNRTSQGAGQWMCGCSLNGPDSYVREVCSSRPAVGLRMRSCEASVLVSFSSQNIWTQTQQGERISASSGRVLRHRLCFR